MGKSKLADAFGKECPMINFVLRDIKDMGYPPPDTEILSFTRMAQPQAFSSMIYKSPERNDKYSTIDHETLRGCARSLFSESLGTILKPQPLNDHQDASTQNAPTSGNENLNKALRERRSDAIWNHSIAVGLIQASVETCKLIEVLLY
jgi:hypothetical protein